MNSELNFYKYMDFPVLPINGAKSLFLFATDSIWLQKEWRPLFLKSNTMIMCEPRSNQEDSFGLVNMILYVFHVDNFSGGCN